MLTSLAETPLPHLLLVGGLAFLLLSVVHKFWTVEMDAEKQKSSMVFGAVLVVLSLGIYLIPDDKTQSAEDASKDHRLEDAFHPDEKANEVDRQIMLLDSYDLEKSDRAAKKLIDLANEVFSTADVFNKLESYIKTLKSPVPVDEFIDDYDKVKYGYENLYAYAKRTEELRVQNLLPIANVFPNDKWRSLVELVLDNDKLWFGRILAADKLTQKTGDNRYWKRLLRPQEKLALKKRVIDTLGNSPDHISEDVMIWALSIPEIMGQTLTKIQWMPKSKKLEYALIEVLSKWPKDSNQYLWAYQALLRWNPQLELTVAPPIDRKKPEKPKAPEIPSQQ